MWKLRGPSVGEFRVALGGAGGPGPGRQCDCLQKDRWSDFATSTQITQWRSRHPVAHATQHRAPESNLPAGSLVLNREQPAWRRYVWPLVGTSLLIAAQGAIIGALLVQRRNRRRVEAALQESEEAA